MPLLRQFLMIAILFSCTLNTSGQEKINFDYKGAVNDFVYNRQSIDQFIPWVNYNAVIVGETHTIIFEPIFKLRLIKHLNDEFGFHDVFMEIGSSAAYLFNKYLETGDTDFITKLNLPYTYGAEYAKFWRGLYEYNTTMPPQQKIVIHGVDFERSDVFKVLLLAKDPGKDIPEDLKPIFMTIEKAVGDTFLQKIFEKPFKEKLAEVQSVFQQHDRELQNLYSKNTYLIHQIVMNDSKISRSVRPRNATMMAHISEDVQHDHITKFIGFFGGAHTDYHDPHSLTNRCQDLAGFAGKIVHISSVYYNTAQTKYGVFPIVPSGNKSLYTTAHEQFLGMSYRASLVKANDSMDKKLKRRADYILFVNDLPLE